LIKEIENIKSSRRKLQKFGITAGVILLLFAGIFFWRGKGGVELFIVIGSLFIAIGIALPVMLKPVYIPWMIFATFFGWIMTQVIISLIFYVVLTPIGLISRLFGKRFLETGNYKLKKSHWNYKIRKKPIIEGYERQF